MSSLDDETVGVGPVTVMRRCRRGDRVYVLGSGPRAQVVRHAACRCGWIAEHPASEPRRDQQYREHREATS